MRRFGRILALGALLVVGCATEEDLTSPPLMAVRTPKPAAASLVTTSGTVATPQPGATHSLEPSPVPSSTPTSNPSPTPSPSPTSAAQSQLLLNSSPAPLPTLPPLATPRPTATVLGERAAAFGLSQSPRLVSMPPYGEWPWVTLGDRLMACSATGPTTTLATISAGVLQVVPDGPGGAWLIADAAEHVTFDPFPRRDRVCAMGEGVRAVAFDAAEIWAVRASQLVVLDRATAATRSVAVSDVQALALGATTLWAARAGGEVVGIRRRDGIAQRQVALAGEAGPMAIDPAGTLWIADRDQAVLWRLGAMDTVPERLEVASTIQALEVVGPRLWIAEGSRLVWFGLDGTPQGGTNLSISPQALVADGVGRIWLGDPATATLLSVFGW